MDAMPDMTIPRSHFVDVQGRRHHLVQWGREGAPVLWLQHGMRDHARSWDWVARHLCDRYHVIAPDLRGHGESDWADAGAYALADYVLDLADLIDSCGVSQVNLVGHSLGGHIAVRYASAYPERLRSLCAIEGIELPIVRDQQRVPKPYPSRLRQWIEEERNSRIRRPRFYNSLADAEARMAAQYPDIDPDTISHLTRHGTIYVAGRGWRWKYDNACRFRAPDDAHGVDLDEVLDAVTCPTLLAYGQESWIPLPPIERLNRIRRHRVVSFPKASHWLHHQARVPFLAALSDFLSDPNSSIIVEREQHA